MRAFGVMILGIGILLVGYALYEVWDTDKKQDVALEQAYDVIETGVEGVEEDVNFEPKKGETIGVLSIPKIEAELPIIEGVDEDELERGVGHFSKTVLPTQGDQILLSGHRDTVFRHMGELKIGDIFEVKMPYGVFKYEIKNTEIVSADDTSVIRSTAPDEVLTVSTCYPFSYIGSAPDRYVLYAYPVK